MAKSEVKRLYRVRFIDQSEKKAFEVIVESVTPGGVLGLITLEGFVFRDNTKLIILPEEDKARERFSKTEKLHIPYHCIVYVEEFDDDPINLKKLPFIRAVNVTENPPHPEV